MEKFYNIREKTREVLRGFKIPQHPHLPLLDGKVRRSPEEVANEAVSVYCLAGLANEVDGDVMLDWLEEEGELDILSDKHLEILEMENIPEGLMNQLTWKLETLFTLCWAGGVVDRFEWPNKGSDLTNVYPVIPPEVKIDDFRRSFRMRPQGEILEALDFYYNLHASLEHPELWTEVPKSDANLGVVITRREALEWLCSRVTDWDDISLDT